MECKENQALLSAHFDRELSLRDSLEIERHCFDCARCQTEYAEYTKLHAALKNNVAYFKAPKHLSSRIKMALPSASKHKSHPRTPWGWLNGGAVLASVIAIVWSSSLYLMTPSATDRLADELVANHVRSLQAAHSTDVASSDQHTVKPWFNGKLDFSPPVSDLTTEGFPLLGGRLDYLDHRPVAVLVYRHRQHTINLFVTPFSDGKKQPPSAFLTKQGYHLLPWIHDGMIFWAVSDVNPTQMEKFRDTFLAATAR